MSSNKVIIIIIIIIGDVLFLGGSKTWKSKSTVETMESRSILLVAIKFDREPAVCRTSLVFKDHASLSRSLTIATCQLNLLQHWCTRHVGIKGIKAPIQCIFFYLHQRQCWGHKHEHQSARAEISPVVGPVNLQQHPTDQYIGVQRGREFDAIISENQASVVELHW